MSPLPPQAGAQAPGDLYGLLAEFDSAASIFKACERLRDAGFRRWDAHTPFPVHGLDRAMGLAPSRLPWIVFGAAMTGLSAGMALQGYTSTIDYPLVISGKPLFSWQAFIMVTFALTVLSGATAAVLGMLHFNRLPRHHHPLFDAPGFQRATDDGFFVSVEASDPLFDPETTAQLLLQAGARSVQAVEQ